jgi:hypothetical protein
VPYGSTLQSSDKLVNCQRLIDSSCVVTLYHPVLLDTHHWGEMS